MTHLRTQPHTHLCTCAHLFGHSLWSLLLLLLAHLMNLDLIMSSSPLLSALRASCIYTHYCLVALLRWVFTLAAFAAFFFLALWQLQLQIQLSGSTNTSADLRTRFAFLQHEIRAFGAGFEVKKGKAVRPALYCLILHYFRSVSKAILRKYLQLYLHGNRKLAMSSYQYNISMFRLYLRYIGNF